MKRKREKFEKKGQRDISFFFQPLKYRKIEEKTTNKNDMIILDDEFFLPKLETLPWEIIYNIWIFSDIEAATQLSKSCKRLYSIIKKFKEHQKYKIFLNETFDKYAKISIEAKQLKGKNKKIKKGIHTSLIIDNLETESGKWAYIFICAAAQGYLKIMIFASTKVNLDFVLFFGLIVSAKNGHLHCLKYCEKGILATIDWDSVICSASKRGHLLILEYCKSRGIRDWNEPFLSAAEHKKLEAMKFCEQNSVPKIEEDSWGEALCIGCEIGDFDMIHYCESHGANQWIPAMYSAAEKGQLIVMEYITLKIKENNIQINWDMISRYAAKEKQLKAMQFCSEQGASQLFLPFVAAAKKNYIDIMEYCRLEAISKQQPLTQHDFNNALISAAKKGALEAMNYCGEYSANDWNNALFQSILMGKSIKAVQCCASWGATNWKRAYRIALRVKKEHLDIIGFCALKMEEQKKIKKNFFIL